MLIRRPVIWTDYEWSSRAEDMHGITREMLDARGLPVETVVKRLNGDIGAADVFSDNPDFDGGWLKRLAEAAGIAPLYTINMVPLDQQVEKPPGVSPLLLPLTIRQSGIVYHRALDDAIVGAFEAALPELTDEGVRREYVQRARKLLADFGRRP